MYAQVKLVEGDFSKVRQKAKRLNKPYVVEFYTSWCGYCKKFEKEVLNSVEVGNYTENRFLVYKLNAEIEKSVAQEFRVSGYPTILIFDADGVVLKRIGGFVGEAQFLSVLKSLNIKEKESSNDFDSYFSKSSKYYNELLGTWKADEPTRSKLLIDIQSAIINNDLLMIEDLRIDYPKETRLIDFLEKQGRDITVVSLRDALNSKLLSPIEVELIVTEKLIVNKEIVTDDALELINELLLLRENENVLALKYYVLNRLGFRKQAEEFKKEAQKKIKKSGTAIGLF